MHCANLIIVKNMQTLGIVEMEIETLNDVRAQIIRLTDYVTHKSIIRKNYR